MSAIEKFAQEWKLNEQAIRNMGIDPSVLGKTVQIEHGIGKIAGIKARNRKMPFIITYRNGTKARKLDLVAFQKVLRENSL